MTAVIAQQESGAVETVSAAADETISPADNTAANQDANTPAGNGEADATSGTDESKVAKQPESLLDAVRDVLQVNTNTEDSTASEVKDTDKSTADADANHADSAKGEEAKVEDEKDVPFHNHPRWKQVLSERDALKAPAEEFNKITGFMHANALSPEEVARGFEIMAAMKNDPVRAREMLAGHLTVLNRFTGDELPQDLQTRVDDGHIDAESAKELAARRSQDEFAKVRNIEVSQRAQQEQAQRAQEQSGAAMRNAVGVWEDSIRTRDVDYEKKQPLVADKVRALMVQRPPSNETEAVAMVKLAYEEVTKTLQVFSPRRQPVSTMTSSGAAHAAKPAPASLQEAVRRAAAGG